ncbi:MAG: isochorismatase family protein [Saprospiraceae bacterium]|nr:isochorismatase family protein [Saprospiraceae bacterium]
MMNLLSRILVLLITGFVPLHAQQSMINLSARYIEDNETKSKSIQFRADETAIIICDMWDKHWCKTATDRVGEMAPLMNRVVKHARSKGVEIIHAPSSTMAHYAKHPGRKRMQRAPAHPSSNQIEDWYYLDSLREGSLPIDDSDGGCDDPKSDCVHCNVWSKQIETIEMEAKDGISDSGREIHNYFVKKGIKNVLLVGVHTNMCVLGRSFGIRSLTHLGYEVVLVRDLTDTMYNPKMPPQVSHSEGTALVIQHVEKYWCPTITSNQVLNN